MWKDYSWSYIKHNRTSGISVVIASFFSAFFLSLLVSLFYNLWNYEVERLEREGGVPNRELISLFVLITVLACLSLVMIIHNAFAISMYDRIHQFGIFSSVGATPGQIRICLLQEAAFVCTAPVLAGNVFGVLMSAGVIKITNILAEGVAGRYPAVWEYRLLLFFATLGMSALTVGISAWIPARKISKITPLQAIKNTGEFQPERKKESRILRRLFGIEGELAGNALKAQKKALRTASLSLTFAFLAFTLMECLVTLSRISLDMTYYEKYQDAWDIMLTVKNRDMETIAETDALQSLSGIRSCVVYQKAEAKTLISGEEISEEFRKLGGFQNAPESYAEETEDGWLVNAPLLILDDESFLDYCGQIGAPERLDGAVVINRILDFTNPNFRDREQFAYVKPERETTVLYPAGNQEEGAGLPVLFQTRELPILREEYGTLNFYELVHVLPLSVWRKQKGQIGGSEPDSCIRVLAAENVTEEELEELEKQIVRLIGDKYEIEAENRIRDRAENNRMIDGMLLIFGGFCVLLALIGIGNVFSNTMGFVYRRKREIARYMSVGLTPGGIRKLFCIEALVMAGRPLLVTLPVTVAAAGLMLKASYLKPMLFIREAPVVPIFLFILTVFGFVALAYYLGGRKVLECDLTDMLRDDTMV